MNKYIKFDDIDKVIREKHANAGSQESGQELFELFMEVSQLPTIEVSEDKEIELGAMLNGSYKLGFEHGKASVEVSSNFCPNCGARMKGADNDSKRD